MKAQKSKRIAVGIIAFLMALTCLFGVMSFSTVAYAASSPAPDASFRGVYKTTDRKPTYTATLNENNKLLKELEEKLNGQSGKKENKALSFTKKYGKDIIDETFSALVLLKKSSSGKETDWEQFGVDLAKNLIVAVAACYGFGGIADSVFNGLEALLANGEAPLSEIEILTDNMDRQFDRMSDQLYDIEEQISALSNDVQKATAEILSGTSSQIENLDAKQVLRAFMTSGEGNFSYTQFQNYIYGSTRGANADKATAYYNQLIEAIVFGADDETIQYYYNKLFDALSSDITIFRQYYFGDVAGLDKSVAKYYYDYLSANPSLIPSDKTAESMSIEFAYDLYSTYVYAYELIKLCYSYQLTEMYIEESLNGRELGVNSKYKYNATDYSFYTVIMNDLEDIEIYVEQAEEAVASDIAYILGMGNSYIVADQKGTLHEVAKYGNTFGNVADGQTIYINKVADFVNNIFEFRPDKYSYYVNGDKIHDVKEQGVINVDDVTDSFSISVKYGNKELYTISFSKEVTNAFSGGSGSYDDPYLISNEQQFQLIGEERNACYELIDDLDFGEYELYPVGTYEKPFNGILNGNGYAISNIRIKSLHYDDKNITITPTTGLFGTIGNNGIVKNLSVKGISVVSDYNNDEVKPEADTSTYYIGAIAGYNEGKIFNCNVSKYVNGDITSNSSIIVKRSKQMSEERSIEVYVGGIAGANANTISYCSIENLLIDAESLHQLHAQSAKTNKNNLFVAGVTATTTGTVSNCKVSNTVKLSAYAKSTANTEDKVKPYVTVKTGGIVANENDSSRLFAVYSDADTIKCRGEVYNDGNHWLLGHRYAYDNVVIKSGVYYPTYFWPSEGDTLDELEENIYYQTKYIHAKADALSEYNGGTITGDVWGYQSISDLPEDAKKIVIANAQKATKQYIISEVEKEEQKALVQLGNNAVTNYYDDLFNLLPEAKYDVVIKYECAHNDGKCSCGCAFEDDKCICQPEQDAIYEINTQLLQRKHMAFFVNNSKVDAQIVNYYGFNTYNELTNTVTNDVKIFFVADIYGENILLSGDVVITVREDRIIGDPVISGIKTEYEINSNKEVGLSEMFEQGFTISYYHANGKVDSYFINSSNRNKVRIYDFDISTCNDEGFIFTILHLETGTPVEQTAKVNCYHRSVLHTSDVSATCQTLGYEIWTCNDCGKIIQKNYMVGDHRYVAEDGVDATCHESGHKQKVYCSTCCVDEDGNVVRYLDDGAEIQQLPHNYLSIAQAKVFAANNNKHFDFNDEKYSEDEYHFCVNGGHYESHQYLVSESTNEYGKMIYVYTCRECGHSYFDVDDNLITDEYGKMPTVFVTNGYVLNVGDEVTVFVQLLNNPGFNGATFGIRYSDGLELIGFDEGTIIPNALSVNNKDTSEVYHGYNYLWAEKEGDNWTENGYLLKLVFKAVSEARETQTVEIVYGEEGGFSTASEKYGLQKFLTHSGSVSFVEHLPGDANEDGIVDIMDAMNIAWYIVKKPGVSVKTQYADVNLDGKVTLKDVVWILQSISGNYGINLLNPEYKLHLNLNGFDTDAFDKLLTVYFYDENGKVNNWNTNISFSEYEAEMNRRGYTFIGWYNRLVGGEQIDTSKQIIYDANLGTQTLYAHWAKNSLSFDMSGATSAQIDDIEYQPNEYLIDLPTPQLQYNVDYYVSGYDGIYNSGTIYKTFDGWYLNGQKVTQVNFNLSSANIGNVLLVAKWSATYNWNMPTESRMGYNNITSWYWKQQYDNEYLIGVNIDDNIVGKLTVTDKGSRVIYGEPNFVKYTIKYENIKTAVNNNSNQFRVIDTVSLNDLSEIYGYNFEGWYLNGIKYTAITPSNCSNLIGNNNIVTLTAKWKAASIALTVRGIISDSNYNLTDIATIYYCYGDDSYGHTKGYYNDKDFTSSIKSISDINFTKSYSNFTIKGVFSTVSDNGHSYANKSGNTYFAENGSPNLFNVVAGSIVAYCCPNEYTITLDINGYGLLDNALTSSSWSGHNSAISYDAGNRKYTLTLSGADDPYCQIDQYVYLEAGKTYLAHMTVSGTTKSNAIQMFYAINGAYTEAASMRFHGGDTTNTFSVSTTGIYRIRIDNDSGSSLTVTNFWITTSFTRSIKVRYNEAIADSIVLPTNQYYIAKYEFGGTLRSDLKGLTYSNSGSMMIQANWNTKKFSNYTYITTAAQLRSMSSTGKYMVITNIDCSGAWTPIASFSGTLDGKGHSIYNFVINDATANSSNEVALGFVGTLNSEGIIRNLQIGKSGYTTKISFEGGEEEKNKCYKKNCTAGMFAGFCNGTIENCKSIACTISTYVWSNNYMSPWNNVGGICGTLRGTVKQCYVYNGNFYSKAMSGYDKNNCDARVGGIAGYTGGCTIESCYVESSTIKSYAYTHWGHANNYAGKPNSRSGGIAGYMEQGSSKAYLRYCVVNGNTIESKITWVYSSTSGGKPYSGLLVGESQCEPVGNVIIGTNSSCTYINGSDSTSHSQASGTNASWSSTYYKTISSATYSALCNAYAGYATDWWNKIM